MKQVRSLISVLLALTVTLSLLAACSAPSEKPNVTTEPSESLTEPSESTEPAGSTESNEPTETKAPPSTFEDYPLSYFTQIIKADLNGDKNEDYIILDCVGIAGGAGSYVTTIYRADSTKTYTRIFLSSKDFKREDNLGLVCTAKDGGVAVISISKYNREYSFTIPKDSYFYSVLYDENGKLKTDPECYIFVDSVFDIKPNDVDKDGCDELICYSYVAFESHSNYIGNAVSVLKYDNESKSMKIIDVYFEKAGETAKNQ